MRKLLKILVAFGFLTLYSCGLNSNKGELTGVEGRRPWFHPQPYGTVYIPTGTFHTGQSDQDIFKSYIAPNKQVSIHAMWMDDTEITNNEYRQFVEHVIDSIARFILDEPYIVEDDDGNRTINYREKLIGKNQKKTWKKCTTSQMSASVVKEKLIQENWYSIMSGLIITLLQTIEMLLEEN